MLSPLLPTYSLNENNFAYSTKTIKNLQNKLSRTNLSENNRVSIEKRLNKEKNKHDEIIKNTFNRILKHLQKGGTPPPYYRALVNSMYGKYTLNNPNVHRMKKNINKFY